MANFRKSLDFVLDGALHSGNFSGSSVRNSGNEIRPISIECLSKRDILGLDSLLVGIGKVFAVFPIIFFHDFDLLFLFNQMGLIILEVLTDFGLS